MFPIPATMHLLGYGVDPQSPTCAISRQLCSKAATTATRGSSRSSTELGVAITMEEVEAEAGGKAKSPARREGHQQVVRRCRSEQALVVGRPHIAAILLRKGYVSSIKQAFDKYLAPGGLAYFDKEHASRPARRSDLIRESGGLPVLAHPVQLRTENDAQLERIVKDLMDLGLVGLEVIHSDHDAALVEKYSAMADRYNLLKTGGSDFHGTNKKDIGLGTANGRKVPREFFDALKERSQNQEPGASRKAEMHSLLLATGFWLLSSAFQFRPSGAKTT